MSLLFNIGIVGAGLIVFAIGVLVGGVVVSHGWSRVCGDLESTLREESKRRDPLRVHGSHWSV
jgi:hypothetical protein